MGILTPTKQKLIILFGISLIFIILSYLFYHVFIIGITDCGSSCSNWLDPILPSSGIFAKACPAMCVLQAPIPNPLYAPLLQVGMLMLILSIVYWIVYLKKRKKA